MPASPASPVFVDDSGRRHRIVRAFGWAVAVVVVLYLGLLGVSLVGSPNVLPLSLPAIGHLLPGPGAPLLDTPQHTRGSSGDVLATVPRHAASTTTSAPPTAAAGTAPRVATASSSAAPTIAATPVATSQPVHGKSTTATSRNPTATTSPTTSTQPRPSQTPPASSKASSHSAHWRAYTTSPSPAPTP